MDIPTHVTLPNQYSDWHGTSEVRRACRPELKKSVYQQRLALLECSKDDVACVGAKAITADAVYYNQFPHGRAGFAIYSLLVDDRIAVVGIVVLTNNAADLDGATQHAVSLLDTLCRPDGMPLPAH